MPIVMLKLNYLSASCFNVRTTQNEYRRWLHAIQTCRICKLPGAVTNVKKGESTLEQPTVLMNNISDQILCKLHINMKMNYGSGLNIHGFWETVLCSNWPEHLRAVGKVLRKKMLQSVVAQCLVQKHMNNLSGQLVDSLASSIKHCLYHEPASEITNHCSNISHLRTRQVSCISKKYCLVIKFHQNMLCRPKGIQNTVLNQNLGIRSVHNLRTTDLFESEDKVQKSVKLNEEETNTQEENTLKLGLKTTKGSHRSRKRQESSKHFKDEDSKTADGHLEGDRSGEVTSKDLQILESRFPHPKGTLHNLYAVVAQELKSSGYCLEKSYQMVPVRSGKKVTNSMWSCTYKVKWPSEANFSATMPTKAAAGKQAALKALHWLHAQGKLTRAGAPLLYNKNEINEMARVPIEVTVDINSCHDIDMLIDWYRKDIEPMLNELETSKNQSETKRNDFSEGSTQELFGVEEGTDPITGLHKRDYDLKAFTQRSIQLYNRYRKRICSPENNNNACYPRSEDGIKRMKETTESLPIAEFREQIVQMVERNPVIVVKGEPGCGKSTQVPQYIMEEWEALQRGAHCNIIVTQPRRLSAISLAERVAHERHERVGDVVGYQVRLKAALPRPPGGALLYCSTGILLRRLQSNPGLTGASHVILDEAHERDINTDILLVLLRRALALNPKLRVIVMSATINAELFQKYFNDAPMLHVPGFTYPVKSFFLEDLNIPRVETKMNMSHVPSLDYQQVATVIRWVDKNRPDGAILCFLPGWAEITAVARHLENGGSYCILPVHSRLSHEEQSRIFSPSVSGQRKIILATNIAETSITINDVVYVIDTGAHKEERLNVQLGVGVLDSHWVSQANVNQRRGRAGRVQPGECYHMYTREIYDSLMKFPVPEVLRVPLEKTVLDCKTYSQDEKALDFLSQMPEPPLPDTVTLAVLELNRLGALDENEMLTPLGRRIAMFTTHPKLSKALVHAAIFRCVNPMVTIATVLTNDSEIFQGGLSVKESIRTVKKSFLPSSDHVSVAWLYREWETLCAEDATDALIFSQQKGLNNEKMKLISRLRKLFSQHLWQSQMLEDSESYKDPFAACNKYAGNAELVKAVLLSGTGSLLNRRSWDIKNGRLIKNANVILTESGQRTTITPESVNYKRKDYPSPFLTSFRQVQSMERRTILVRETSLLSPLSVLLFTMGQLTVQEYNPPSGEDKWSNHVLVKVNQRSDIMMLCDKSQVRRLAELRAILWNLITYFVMKEGMNEDNDRYEAICSFHERFLEILCTVMHNAGAKIE